ncbi:PREDICTED: protection of telomeres protein 1b [Tarenaya hassleriana]|uniref:protection of telomeres protein 1b n=1 Tax=Tarenaya hassleriana TaxID=28532 RepID=UPI0008FD86BB|nr:PREDICTED: protection of telomeres protein 1b [Tarenaya hassleriana]
MWFKLEGHKYKPIGPKTIFEALIISDIEMKDDYKFLRIIDAYKTLHLRVNLVGVIVELGFPNGSGCSCAIKIVDPWSSGFSLPVQFLARTIQSLPRVELIGDIVLLSRVKMMLINGKMTAVFHETLSSFALFKGKGDGCFFPYQSSPKFQMREEDKNFISNLREWEITYKLKEGSGCFTFLKDVKEGECSNLSVWIVHISKEDKDRWFIFIWDGTDLPPCSISTKACRVPLHVEPEKLSTNVLREFPTVGSVLRVEVGEASDKQAIHCLKPGQHLKFLNLLFRVDSGLWSGILTQFTKMQYAMNPEMQTFKHQSQDLWRKICIGPPHSGITGVAHEDAPFVTLMDVLTYHKVTAKFRCVVRVVAAYPWNVEKFRDSEGKYKVLFILEDATARISASLYADEGVNTSTAVSMLMHIRERFFGGDLADGAIAEKLNRLTGRPETDSEDAERNSPWVQCCLFSYYKDKKDRWGSRRFRIFRTWIITSSSRHM